MIINGSDMVLMKDVKEVGACMPCILFLSQSKKNSLGAYVCSPFTNYKRPKELLEKHSKNDSHLRAVDRAY